MKPHVTATIIAAALLLAGCGGAVPASNTTASASNSGAGPATPPADWNATDACAVIDKAAMGRLLGATVTETSLALVHQASGAEAATSECSYLLADGGRASLMLRWSPIGDNDEGAINLARNSLQQTMKAFGGTVETLAGVGKAAFWVGKTGSLNVFVGSDKFLIVTVPSGPRSQARAIAVARKLGA